jgi:4-amino-4-deoxy-L-arabinose transferase-like glycosyltransferase
MMVGLVFRLGGTVWSPLIYPDSCQYLHLAREIAAGIFFSSPYDLEEGFLHSRQLPLLYSFLVSPFILAGLRPETAGTLVSLLANLAGYFPLYFATQALFLRRSAIAGVALYTFHTATLRYASAILTESLFASLYLAAMWATARALRRGRARDFLAAGVAAGLAYLAREPGLICLPGLAALTALKMGLELKNRRRAADRAALAALMFGMVALPYLLHVRVRTGHWSLTARMSTAGIVEWVLRPGPVNLPDSASRESDVSPPDRPLSFSDGGPLPEKAERSLTKRIILSIMGYGKELGRLWGPLPTALVIIGLGRALKSGRRRGWWALLLAMLPAQWGAQLIILYALAAPAMEESRYLYPILPLGYILAGLGVEAVAESLVAPGVGIISRLAWLAGSGLYLAGAPFLAQRSGKARPSPAFVRPGPKQACS